MFKQIMKNFRAIKSKSLFAIAFVSLVPLSAMALTTIDALSPQINVSEIKTNKTEASVGEKIDGSFKLKNEQTTAISGVVAKVRLSKNIIPVDKDKIVPKTNNPNEEIVIDNNSIDLSSSLLVDEKKIEDSLSFKGSEARSLNFSYQTPKNLLSGDYVLAIDVLSGRGDLLGNSEDLTIKISGNDTFVAITNAKILTEEGHEVDSTTGPNFSKETAPKIRFTAENQGKKGTDFTPSIEVYKRTSALEVDYVKKEKQKNISLAVGEKKTFEITLPKMEKPTVYLANLALLDESSNPVSNSLSYRWVIKGLSPQFFSLNADKNLYNKGEKAKVSVEILGSADLTTKGESGDLLIEILNEKGNVVGSYKDNISLDGLKKDYELKLNSSINGFKIKASVSKGGETLDTYEIKVKGDNLKTTYSILQLLLMGIGIILILVFIGGAVYFFKHSKGRGKIMGLFILAFIASMMYSGKAFAADIKYIQSPVSGGVYEINHNWTSPTGSDVLYRGSTLSFKGTYQERYCGNTIVNPVYRFYIVQIQGDDLMAGNASIWPQNLDTTASVTAHDNMIYGLDPYRISAGSAPDGIDYLSGGVQQYHRNYTIPTTLDDTWISDSDTAKDTYAVVDYRGDHIDTNGNIVNRYRVISRQKIKILNRAPVATQVSPSNNTSLSSPSFGPNEVAKLKGQATDPDIADLVRLGIQYRKVGDPTWNDVFPNTTGNPLIWERDVGILPAGTYEWQVRSIDVLPTDVRIDTGFVGTWKFTVGALTPPLQPTCTLLAAPSGGKLPLTVSLSASTNMLGPNLTYDWVFGDGTSTVMGSSQNPTNHVYTKNATITPSVTIHDNTASLTCTATTTFTVDPWSGGNEHEVAP